MKNYTWDTLTCETVELTNEEVATIQAENPWDTGKVTENWTELLGDRGNIALNTKANSEEEAKIKFASHPRFAGFLLDLIEDLEEDLRAHGL